MLLVEQVDRRRRQAEGIARARAAGPYRGRPENEARNTAIAAMLRDGRIWREIIDATGCGRTLLAEIARERKARPEPPA